MMFIPQQCFLMFRISDRATVVHEKVTLLRDAFNGSYNQSAIVTVHLLFVDMHYNER